MVTQQSGLLRLSNGQLQPLNGKGILGADIDVALPGIHSVGRDHHALDHPVGVAFHDAAIHKRAGVALVAVADHIAHRLLLGSHLAPLLPRREACAAPAPEPGIRHGLDHRLGRHFKQRLFKALVGTGRQRGLDALGVDMAAVFQHQTGLLGIEGDLLLRGIDLLPLMIHEPLHPLPLQDGLFKNLLTVALLHLQVEVAVRLNPHQGTHFAEAVAAAFVDADLPRGFGMGDFRADFHLYVRLSGRQFLHALIQSGGAAGKAAGAAADENAALLLLQSLLTLRSDLLKLKTVFNSRHAVPPLPLSGGSSAAPPPFPASFWGAPAR